MTVELPALYRISGTTNDGEWHMLVKAKTPGAALEHAMTKNSWNILEGVHISIETNFYDMIEHEALAASVSPSPQQQEMK